LKHAEHFKHEGYVSPQPLPLFYVRWWHDLDSGGMNGISADFQKTAASGSDDTAPEICENCACWDAAADRPRMARGICLSPASPRFLDDAGTRYSATCDAYQPRGAVYQPIGNGRPPRQQDAP
jgi:hypothetical protein